MAQTRRNGFAMTSGSVARGVSGVGIPIQPRRGLLQLAISVSAVIDEMDEGEARKFALIMQSALQQASFPA